jgi:hypothetical protein
VDFLLVVDFLPAVELLRVEDFLPAVDVLPDMVFLAAAVFLPGLVFLLAGVPAAEPRPTVERERPPLRVELVAPLAALDGELESRTCSVTRVCARVVAWATLALSSFS